MVLKQNEILSAKDSFNLFVFLLYNPEAAIDSKELEKYAKSSEDFFYFTDFNYIMFMH